MARKTEYPNPMFADRLAQAIHDANVTQKEVASWCGKERKAVNSWVNCVSYPNVGDLAHLCKNLHVSADYLLFGKE